MKSTDFKRWLAAQGATLESAKGSHLKVLLNGKTSYLPMHSKDFKKGTVEGIKKQLEACGESPALKGHDFSRAVSTAKSTGL